MTETKKVKKPLRRSGNGRFAENTAVFTSDEMAKAIEEYKTKQEGKQNDAGTARTG